MQVPPALLQRRVPQERDLLVVPLANLTRLVVNRPEQQVVPQQLEAVLVELEVAQEELEVVLAGHAVEPEEVDRQLVVLEEPGVELEDHAAEPEEPQAV